MLLFRFTWLLFSYTFILDFMSGLQMMSNSTESLENGESLLGTMDGDLDEARRMARLFFETGSLQMDEMLAACRDRKREAMLFHVHKCAGGAAACGFDVLACQLQNFEKEGLDMNWNNASQACADLIQLFAETRNSVDRYFEDQSGQS